MAETPRDASRFSKGCGRRGALVLILLGMLATGCGYSNQSLYRQNVRTVYVDMFHTREFRRGIEFQLTEALRKQISRATPYKNAPKQKADTVLEGEVLDWEEAGLGKDYVTDRPRELAGTLSVRYRWQDMRTGKLLVDKPLATTTVQYVRLLGEDSFNGYELAVDQMARQIVDSMESPW